MSRAVFRLPVEAFPVAEWNDAPDDLNGLPPELCVLDVGSLIPTDPTTTNPPITTPTPPNPPERPLGKVPQVDDKSNIGLWITLAALFIHYVSLTWRDQE